MIVREIVPENLSEYLSIIPPDIADNIGRRHHKGVAFHETEDGPAVVALVIFVQGAEWDGDEKNILIEWMYLNDDESTRKAIESVRENAVRDGIKSLNFIIPVEEQQLYSLLKEHKYECVEAESPFIDISLEEVRRLKLGNIDTGDVVPINDITVRQFRRVLTNMIFHGARGLLEDAEYLPKSWFEGELSAFIPNGNSSRAALLVRKTSSGVLVPVLFAAFGSGSAQNLLKLMNYFAKRAGELYSPDTKVRITRFNANTKALAKKLCPEKKGARVYVCTRHET